MRGQIQFRVFQKITYLLILFVTDGLFVGKYAFFRTFLSGHFLRFFFLFLQNNRVVTDPNGLQMWLKKTYLISQLIPRAELVEKELTQKYIKFR